MTTIYTTTAGNNFYFMDLCVLATDEAEARAKFTAFIEALDYSDEEKAGGLYSFDAVEEVDSVSGWLGEPTETVQMTNSGCNG